MPEMGERLAGGEADMVADRAGEQHAEAIHRAARLGEISVERVEPAGMALGQLVEPGVKPGERLAMRGQDEQIGGSVFEASRSRRASRRADRPPARSRTSETFEVIRGST